MHSSGLRVVSFCLKLWAFWFRLAEENVSIWRDSEKGAPVSYNPHCGYPSEGDPQFQEIWRRREQEALKESGHLVSTLIAPVSHALTQGMPILLTDISGFRIAPHSE